MRALFCVERYFICAVGDEDFDAGVFGEPGIDDLLGVVGRAEVRRLDEVVGHLGAEPDSAEAENHLCEFVGFVAV